MSSTPAAAPSPDPSADTKKSPWGLVLLVVVALLVVSPIVVLTVSPWKASGSIWYLGMLPSLMGLFVSRRVALAASVVTPLIVAVSLLLHDQPAIVGALYMAVLGVATGLAARRGWHVMLAFAAPIAALALIGDMHVAMPSGREAAYASPETILMTMAVLCAGGVWTALLGPIVLNKMHVSAPALIPRRTSIYFAMAMGFLVGATSFVALMWLPPNSWWIVLTMYVVVQPYYAAVVTRVGQRILGTLVGALGAVIVVAVFHNYPLVIAMLAAVLTLAAAYANLRMPYWVFVTFLTPAVVLQTSGGTRDLAQAIGDRTMYTLIGAALAIVVMAVGHQYLVRHPSLRTPLEERAAGE